MAEKQYTGAGEFGKGVRSALSSAYDYVSGNIKDVPRKTKLLFDEYLSNPLYNKYPQLLLNPTNIPLAAAKAGVEALGGVANVPINLSDNVLTQEESEPPEPEPTLANRDLLSEYYGGFDNVPVRKAEAVNKKQAAQKLYRVMYAGKGAENSEVYETKAEADAALKKAGGKGAVAGIDMSRKAKDKSKVSNRNYLKEELGEKLSADETEARKQKYIDQLAQTKMDKMVYDEQLKRAKSPEYKAALQERGRLANEAKRAKDKEAGAGFESWRSDVKARRMSEDDFNAYNQRLDLLKQAYSNAKSSGRLKEAYDISMDIDDFQAGIPKEMGARRKEIERRTLATRNALLADQERSARIQAANPDYINPFNKTIGMRYQ
jgi:hypothetical protein